MNIEQIVYTFSKSQGLSDNVAKIIVAQSKFESSNYTSNLFKVNNNLFGYKYVGQSIATQGIPAPSSEGNLRYANYSKVEDSVLEIVKWIGRRVSEKKFTLADLETPEGYARAFKNAGYYGDTYERYVAGLRRYYNTLQVGNQQQTPQPTPQPTPQITTQSSTSSDRSQPTTNVIPANKKETVYVPSILSLNNYNKDYVILTSNRVVINSKEDSIILTSKKTIGISATEQVHFNIGPVGTSQPKDPTKYFFIINSPAIQLGLSRDGDNEPVAKADSTISFIKELIKALQDLSQVLKTSKGAGSGTVTLLSINTAGDALYTALQKIKDKYVVENSPIKSKITKTI